MNGPFQVAQASTPGTTRSSNSPTRIFTLTKPLGDQAVVINLGYDQKVKVDFSAIANEKITLVHIGEKLIILFDNKSTLTIEPFFDSRHDGINNLAVEVAPGRDVSVSEFASLFPITTDQSVLPAAGDGNGNAQASGAHFSNAAVDPLGNRNPLALLGQEELGNFVTGLDTFDGTPTVAPKAGFTLSGVLLVHDETLGIQVTANDQANILLPAGFKTTGLIGWAQSSISEIATATVDFGTNGPGTVAYALTTATGGAFAGVDSGLHATATGNEIFLFTEGAFIVAREGAGGVPNAAGAIAFELFLDPVTLKLDVAQYEAIGHGNPLDPNDRVSLAGVVFVQQTVTDALGGIATAVSAAPLGVAFDDDAPKITAHEGEIPSLNVDESFLTAATNAGVDGSGAGPAGSTVDHGFFAGAFTSVAGTDGATIVYKLGVGGTPSGETGLVDSGLIDSATGLHVVLVLTAGGVVEGHVGTAGGATVFTLAVNAATAEVTLTQLRSVHENSLDDPIDQSEGISLDSVANLVTLTATITDGDGDKASASIDLGTRVTFHDDGPSIAAVEPSDGETGEGGAPSLNVDESFLLKATNGVDGSGTGPLGATTDHASFSGMFTSVQGADHATIVYKLDIATPSEESNVVDSGLIDSGTGQHVVLVLTAGGVVEGHVGTAGGLTVFTLAVDAATAEVTLTQLRAVHEGTGEAGDISEGVSLNSVANLVTLTATITDNDGDSASASIDLGTHVTFHDDGPSLTVAVTEGFHVTHDETLGLQSAPFGDDNDILFTPVFNGVANPGHDPDGIFGLPLGYAQSTGSALTIGDLTYGADGAALSGSKLFSLTLTDGEDSVVTGPVDSGIKTTDGHEIFLFVENGLIVGRYDVSNGDVTGADPAAFAVAIDSTSGKVSLVQYVSLFHSSADANGDIDEPVSLANAIGQIKATVTLTDADGDTASASANISADIQFEDDGPTVLASVTRNFGVTADETPGIQANDVTGPLPVFADVLNPGDDPDVSGTVLAYATSSGAALSVLPFFGVDGPDPSTPIAYSLKLNSSVSGVTLTDGTEITLSQDSSGRVIGTVGTDTVHPELNGKAAFAIAIDPVTGQVSVVEYLSLNHPNSSNPNDTVSIAAGSISAVVTIKDGDGDTASASKDISGRIHFNDDGPKLISETSVAGNVDEDGLHAPGLSNSNLDNLRPGEVAGTNSAVAIGGPGTLKALVDFGADGFGSFGLKTVGTPVDSGLTSQGGHILLVTDANGLHGYVDNGTPGFGVGDREVFTLTVGADGSYVFTLKDQVDHPTLDGKPGDNTENTLSIDLSSYVVATDGDGDGIPLGNGTFTVTVLDDIPVITARAPESTTITTTETITYSLQAGNPIVRGMNGQNDHDILLTGVDINEGDNSVNTTGSKIGIGDAQSIDGYDGKHTTGPEILTMEFFNGISVTGNPNTPVVTHGAAYDVSSTTFSIDVAEAQGVETAVVFVSATHAGSFVALNFTVGGSAFAATAVFQGGVQVGYVLDGVSDLSAVTATGATPFDTLKVGNYDHFQFNTTASGDPQTFTDGNSFKVFGIESTITTTTIVTETFKVSEDESAGVNTAADPNAANDVNPLIDIPPAAIAEANAIGYAKSPTSVLASGSLFAGSVGADEPGHYTFAVTDKDGNAINGVDSGLQTLDGSHIMLSTDASGAVVGSVGLTDVFKVYVDGDGFVWIAQYQAIANGIAGSSAAAFDDIATVTADLHIKATLTDFDGDSTSAVSGVALVVQFQDDGPLAVNDVDSANGAALTATGNVITGVDIAVGFDANSTDGNADTKGTDGAKITEIAGVTTDTTPDGSHNFQVTGQYGTLVINENGDYTYTRFDGSPVVANDVFTYTLTDGDGDFSTAKLTIGISDHGVSVSGINLPGGDINVFENDLLASRGANEAAGSSPGGSLTQTGTFAISATDGLNSLTIDGHAVVTGGVFTATSFTTATGNTFAVTAFDGVNVSYSYTLLDNEQHAAIQGNNILPDNLTVIATDIDGDFATSTIKINIVDDVPTAVADTDAAQSGQTVIGNVESNDTAGADGIASIAWTGAVGNTVTLAHGVLTFDANGGYSYHANPNTSGTDVFSYTITDGDGDTSPSTLTITVSNGRPSVSPATAQVDEAALDTSATGDDLAASLVTGSNPGSTAETVTGTVTFSDPDSPQVTNIAGATSSVVGVGGVTVQGTYGLLHIDQNGAYTYTLTKPYDTTPDSLTTAAQVETGKDVFTYTVTDSFGNSSTSTISIDIKDDVPTAVDDGPYGVVEDAASLVSGNVLSNDISGADTPKSFVAWGGATDTTAVAALNSYGTLVQNNDGTWSFTLDNSRAATQALTASSHLSYTLHYTMTDADGDQSSAILTIKIDGADDSASVVTAQLTGPDATVYESGLNPNGSNAAAATETTTGSFTISATDGVHDIVVGGTTFTLAQIQAFAATNGVVNTGEGILTLTNYSGTTFGGTVSYSYTLSATIDNDSKVPVGNDTVDGTGFNDSVALTVNGIGGTTASDNLVIRAVDDTPTAVDDGPYGVVEDAASLVSGNVLSNDISGADTPKSFVAWGGATDTTAVAALNSYGTLVQNNDGTWSFTLDNSRAATQALTASSHLSYTLHYTMTDADGDQSSAILTIKIDGADDSASVVTAQLTGPDATVYESGLNPNGSNAAAATETTTGSFTISATDGVHDIVVGGTTFTLAQIQAFAATNGVVNTGEGILTLTNYSGTTFGGTVSYSYTLSATIDNDSKVPVGNDTVDGTGFNDSVALTVNGIGGTTASDNLVIRAVDDTPTAVDDGPYGVVEDAASLVSGNVLSNDISGADTPKSFVAWGGATDTTAVAALNSYGTLVQNNDGTWSFTLDNSRAATQALTASSHLSYTLHYTMTDADGDQSSAILTIKIDGADDSASVVTAQLTGPDATVYESGLNPNGSNAAAATETTTGSFTISATDGVHDIVVGGTTFTLAQIQAFAATNGVVNTGEGILTLTNYSGTTFGGTVSYSYTLSATIDNDSKVPVGNDTVDGTGFNDSVALTVNGIGGTTASDNLVIRAVDDTPTAVDDGPYGVVEDAASLVSGNVLSNDISGADTPKSFVAWGGATDTTAVAALNSYGTLVQNNDGTWSFTLDNSRAATQALTASSHLSYTLHYTMTDADGDQSSAILTIKIDGADDSASVVTAQLTGPDATVYESGLNPNGSNAAAATETTTGSFTISATDGVHDIVVGGTTFTLAQIQAFAATNGVVNTGEGILTLTNYSGTTFGGTVSYSYTLSATIDNDSKVPVGNDTVDGTGFNDSVALTVNGIGGTTASDNLVIRAVDDTPTAVDDGPYGVVEDAASLVSGNVLSNDISGADTPKSFVAWGGATDTTAVAALNSYGTLVQNNDGTWSFTLDNSRAATQALTASSHLSYTLHYTMTDADGDQSSAILTIKIDGADDSASVVTAQLTGPDATVYESGLNPNGSNAAAATETTTGSFTISATDGVHDIVVGGTTFTLAQIQAFAATNGVVNTGEGILTLTNYSGTTFGGTVSYSYTLSATIDNDSKVPVGNDTVDGTGFNDSVALTVNGIGGTTASDNLVIRAVDDTPTAVDDGPYGVVEDAASLVSGNVLSNDISGADTPKSFVAWGGATDTTAVAALNSYGTLVQNNDGTWSFTLDNSRAATQALTASSHLSYTLHYTMTDADGDQSSAILTIKIDGADDSASVVTAQLTGPDATVYESGLNPNGSNAAAATETTTGSFTISATDGVHDIVVGGTTFTLAQIQAFAATNGVVNTGEGILTLTNYSGTTFGGTVSYSYTLSATIDNDSKVPVGNDTVDGTGFNDSVALTVNGIGGTTASDNLVIRAVDDVPTAVNDTWAPTITGATVLTGLLNNDTFGADGVDTDNSPVTGQVTVTTGATHGTVVYNNNGTFTYTPTAGYNGTDSFTYTIKDGDGDTSTATVTLSDIHTNSIPTAGTQSITVDEDGLTNGIAGGPGDVSGAAITQTGNLIHNFNTDGPSTPASSDPINFSPMDNGSHNTAVGLSSGGAPLTYYWDASGDTLYASTNTSSLANAQSTAAFKVALNTATGDYTYTQLKPIDHPGHDADGLNDGPETSYEDNVIVNLTYQVKDSNGDSATGTLAVTINDDTPVAVAESATASEQIIQDLNAAFVLDMSGSIDGTEYGQMMAAVKAAGDQMFIDATGAVKIELIGFASTAVAAGPFTTQAAFDAQITAWTSSRPLSSSTDYSDAIQLLMSNYTPIAGQNNQVFFLSDGNPNENTGSGGQSLSDTVRPLWNTFVNNVAAPITVTTIGIGNGIDTAHLSQVDVDAGSHTPLTVAQFSDLIDTLVTIVGNNVTGNVLSNGDGFGADGGRILSITFDSHTYTWNGQTGASASIVETDSVGNTIATITGTTTLSAISTVLTGKFTFYFAASGSHVAGDWVYSGPQELVANSNETFTYVLTDNDGDHASAALTVAVTAINDAPVNNVPAAQTVAEDTGLVFSGAGKTISISDVDAGSGTETVTLSVLHGTLTLSGLTGLTSISGNGTGSVTFTGSVTDANNALNGLTYQGAQNYNGADTLTITTNDNGNTGSGGAKSDTDTVDITVTAVNDAPVAVADVGAVNENATLTKTVVTGVIQGAGTDTDVDNATSSLLVSGAVAGTGAVTQGSGVATSLAGTYGHLTLAADGSYTYVADQPAADDLATGVTANDVFTYTVKDPGNLVSNTTTLTITVTGLDDAPATDLNGASAGTAVTTAFTEQTPVLVAPAATITDVDNANLSSMTVTLTNRPDGNAVESLSLNAAATLAAAGLTVSYTASTGVLLVSGSASKATYQTILEGVLYNDTSDNPNTTNRSVTVVVSDGSLSSVSNTATITVAPVNDAPTATITPATYSATEQTSLTLKGTGLSISDALDGNTGTMTVTLSVGEGTLTATAGNSGVASLTGSGTSTITVTGTVSQINTFLASGTSTLTYIDNIDNPAASTQLTLTVNDNGNVGGGALTGSDVATINITGVNDAPVVSGVSVDSTGHISFSIADPDSSSFTIVNTPAGIAAAFSSPTLSLGSNTLNVPTEQASVISGTLQIQDGPGLADDVIGVYLGTSAANTITVPLAGSLNAIYGFGGNDIINLAAGNFVAGTYIDGGIGTDTINLTTTGDGQSMDFTVGTIANIENLVSVNQGSGNGYDQTFTITAAQWAGLSSINMNDGTDTLNIQVNGAVDISSSGAATITNTETVNVTGVSAADSLTLTGAQMNALITAGAVIDLGSGGTDSINLTSTSTGLNTLSDARLLNVETVSVSTAATINLGNQTESININGSSGDDIITAATGGGTINAGLGADTVTINAGSVTGKSWTVDLGNDSVADKVVFSHTALGVTDNTVVTVNNFHVADDKVAVTLNGTAIADGTFQTVTATQTNITGEVVELVAAGFVTSSLTDDANAGAIETIIASATNGIPVGNYTFIIYSNTTGTADAGVYTVNITDATDPTSAGMTVEHIMTLNGVGYGNLADANFVQTSDPIVLDLGNSGVAFSTQESGVQFDINGDGVKDQVAWTANGQDGILALDVNGSGKIESGNELFTPNFAGGHFANGIAALASLDTNHDGVIDSHDPTFSQLVVWQDANHNGVSDTGELTKLTDIGIKSIDLATLAGTGPIDGQNIAATGSFTYADGSKGSFVEADLDTALGSSATSAGGDVNLPPQLHQGGMDHAVDFTPAGHGELNFSAINPGVAAGGEQSHFTFTDAPLMHDTYGDNSAAAAKMALAILQAGGMVDTAHLPVAH